MGIIIIIIWGLCLPTTYSQHLDRIVEPAC